MLDLQPNEINAMFKAEEVTFECSIPITEDSILVLNLTEYNIFADGFVAKTNTGEVIKLEEMRFFKGIVGKDSSSFVSMTLSRNGIDGIITGKDYGFTLGRFKKDNEKGVHLLYKTKDMDGEHKPFECSSEKLGIAIPDFYS